jgi:hypothetical protein
MERMSSEEYQKRYGSIRPGSDVRPASPPPIRLPKPSAANKTEERYGHVLQCEFKESSGYRIGYEEITLRLKDGTKYTPDWIVWKGSEVVLAVECKGSFKLGSQGRSVTAFKRAIHDFPEIEFRFAQDSKDGWRVVSSKKN